MKLKLYLALLAVLLQGIQPAAVHAQENGLTAEAGAGDMIQQDAGVATEAQTQESTDEDDTIQQDVDVAAEAQIQETETEEIPYSISNNRYILESLRLTKLAEETYKYGDYDSSENFAREAVRYAGLSDEYVALQMKIMAADQAIAAAKFRMDWAVSSGASTKYPTEYNEATIWYRKSLDARNVQDWDNTVDSAQRVVELFAYIEAPGPKTAETETSPLPATYTVREWITYQDCLWNIAGRSWVYNDPFKWQLLYNANKSKFPEPDNPNRIEPGMVLDIPSLKGETREGMWDSGASYEPLP